MKRLLDVGSLRLACRVHSSNWIIAFSWQLRDSSQGPVLEGVLVWRIRGGDSDENDDDVCAWWLLRSSCAPDSRNRFWLGRAMREKVDDVLEEQALGGLGSRRPSCSTLLFSFGALRPLANRSPVWGIRACHNHVINSGLTARSLVYAVL